MDKKSPTASLLRLKSEVSRRPSLINDDDKKFMLKARLGKARQGTARRGSARQGRAWHGME